MHAAEPRLLYVCADGGIPVGGTKGGAVHIRAFLDALEGTPYQATVLAARTAPGTKRPEHVPLFELPADPFDEFFRNAPTNDRDTLREVRAFLQNAAAAKRLDELRRDVGFDLIYERYALFSMAVRMWARRVDVPYVLEVNAPLVQEATAYRSLKSVELARAVERYVFTTADHIVAVSDAVRDYIREIAPDTPITVVPNGVDAERFSRPQPATLPPELTAPAGLRIGFVGAVRPWHGVDVLIESLGELNLSYSDWRLVIIGDPGKDGDALTTRARALGIAERVHFAGPLPYEAIPAALDHVDVLVAPYPKLERFYFSPLKIFEYMAAGKAIVASSIGQIESVLRHDETALLVPPGDRRALCASLLRMSREPKLRQRLGRAARAEVEQHHTWQHRLTDITAIMDDLRTAARGKDVPHAAQV